MRYFKTMVLMAFLLLISCSRKDEKALLDSAQQKTQNHDITGAIAEYKNLLSQFGESPKAAQGYYELGRLYQSHADPTLNPETSLKLALDNYAALVQKFPNDQHAPEAQFLIGFINTNELQKYDLGKAAYEEFLRRYPNHAMAASAREEIRTMGMTPDEILSGQPQKEDK